MLLSINHQKGGTGKSTICWNLIIEMSKKRNLTIEVVDLDVQQTLTLNNYVREAKGLKPFNVKTFKESGKLQEYILTDSDSKIIIIDTGGFDSELNRVVALLSDLIITPVSDSTVELQGLQTYAKVLEELNSHSNEEVIAHVLLNSVDPRRKNLSALTDFINETNHLKSLNSVIRRRSDFGNSITAGKSVVEFDKKSKAAKELISLKTEILKLLQGGN